MASRMRPPSRKLPKPDISVSSLPHQLESVMRKSNRDARLSQVAADYERFAGLIWDFREKHGWKYAKGEYKIPPGYFRSTVRQYGDRKVSRDVYDAIRFLSSQEAIEAIRQRGRMRQPKKPLDRRRAKKISSEMNAALRWALGRKLAANPRA